MKLLNSTRVMNLTKAKMIYALPSGSEPVAAYLKLLPFTFHQIIITSLLTKWARNTTLSMQDFGVTNILVVVDHLYTSMM